MISSRHIPATKWRTASFAATVIARDPPKEEDVDLELGDYVVSVLIRHKESKGKGGGKEKGKGKGHEKGAGAAGGGGGFGLPQPPE